MYRPSEQIGNFFVCLAQIIVISYSMSARQATSCSTHVADLKWLPGFGIGKLDGGFISIIMIINFSKIMAMSIRY